MTLTSTLPKGFDLNKLPREDVEQVQRQFAKQREEMAAGQKKLKKLADKVHACDKNSN